MNFLKLLAQKLSQDVEELQCVLVEAINEADDLDANMKKTVSKKVTQATWTAEQYAEYRTTAYQAGREKAKETRETRIKRPRLTPEERLKLAERDLQVTLNQSEKAREYVEELREKLQ